MQRRGRLLVGLGVTSLLVLVTAAPAVGAEGDLSFQGCIAGATESGPNPPGSGACSLIPSASAGGVNSGLDNLGAMMISADGTSVYTLSDEDDAVAHWRREPATGALTYVGCITGETESSGACTAIPEAKPSGSISGLGFPVEGAASADGRSVYALSEHDDALAAFDRDQSSGALSYDGCASTNSALVPGILPPTPGVCGFANGFSGNGADTGLDSPSAVAVSRDGESIYTASLLDDAIMTWDRDPITANLVGPMGCQTGEQESGPAGSGACTTIPFPTNTGANTGLDQPTGIAVSPEGASVYMVSELDDAIAHWRRDTTTGALTYDGCITGETQSGGLSGGGTGACQDTSNARSNGFNTGLDSLSSVIVSPDGESVYTASKFDDAIAHFDRNLMTGALSFQGCITGDTSSGPVPAGPGSCAAIPRASPGGDNSGLDLPGSLAASTGGTSVYVIASSDAAITQLSRDPATGALSFRGCVTGETQSGPAGTGACALIPTATPNGINSSLSGPTAVEVSPDGSSVYSAAFGDSAVVHFNLEPATQPPGDPPPDGTADTTAPGLDLRGKRKQDVDKLKLSATVDEAAALSGRASLSLPKGRAVIKSRKVVGQAEGGQRQLMKFRFARKALRRIKGALADGKRLTARAEVVATDAAGNASTARRRIRLTN